MACALALVAAESALGSLAWAAADGDESRLLSDATTTAISAYSYHAISAQLGSGQPVPELAALRIDGRDDEAGITVLRRGSDTLVAVDALLAALQLPARWQTQALHVETPLGTTTIDTGQCLVLSGAAYCALADLRTLLSIDLLFDAPEFLLRVRTAWPAQRADRAPMQDPIDVSAPRYSLSYARSQLGYQHSGDRSRLSGSGELGGGLGEGYWRSAWFQDSTGRRGLYDYAWISQVDNTRYLLGHQVLGLDPLLPSFDILGAQVAWTNRPQSLFDGAAESRRLVADRYSPNRVLRGQGPPGGRAELRVDGELRDSVTIPLTGAYAFPPLQRAVDPLSVVQVHLFEHPFDSVPTRIEDRSFSTSDRLLEQGAMLHFAGLGTQDNPLGDSLLGGALRAQGVGFWQARYGVAEALSVEAAVQRTMEGEFVLAGAHLGLGGAGTLSTLLARNGDGARALRVQTDGRRREWFWRGYTQQEDAGYRGGGVTGERASSYAEAGLSRDWWMLSLIGRRERDDASQRDLAFVRPAVSIQPLRSLSLSVRPDSEGDYGVLARWAPTARLHFNAFRDDDSDQLEAQMQVGNDSRLVAGWVREPGFDSRQSLLGYVEPQGSRSWRFGAGVLRSGDRIGWLVEAGAELGAGSYLGAQAVDDPLQPGQGTTLWLNLTVDLVNSGNGFVRSGQRANYSRQGSLAGRIELPAGAAGEAPRDVAIRVDGEIRTYTDASGGFHVGGLAPGVHRVELDVENLPLDTAPTAQRLGVEVAPGRSTPVRFALALRLGLVGRVLDREERGLPNAMVRLLGAEGEDMGVQATDAYGVFRFADLPPGRYRLQHLDESASALMERPLELVDTYLFDQDLRAQP
jgi:hypothetical protein